MKQGFNDVIKEASRISTSAKQNENSLLALIQNTEALGMMKAVKMMAPDQDLQHLTNGVPISETEREMKEQQGESVRKVLRKCDDLVPQSRLSELAGYYPGGSASSTTGGNNG